MANGKVLVEVHPPRQHESEALIGRLRGTTTETGDITGPIGDGHGSGMAGQGDWR